MTPLNHFQPVTETQNTDQDSDDIVTRSREDEKRVFAVISNLFPSAREDEIGIKFFYFQVKKTLGLDLDDNLWVPFVWDTVYTMMNNYRQRMSQAPDTYVKHGNIPYCDIPLSQIWNSQINIEYHESSDRLRIISQNQNANSSSIDIENIASANNHHTNTQQQPVSVTPIHDSIGANWSFSDRFNIPLCHNDTSTPSIDIEHIAVSHIS